MDWVGRNYNDKIYSTLKRVFKVKLIFNKLLVLLKQHCLSI